jgi:heme exporter protein A
MLEALDLAGRRGHARLFAGLRFAVAPGEALIVTGPNGTGKTTLLRMLAGLTAPDAGEIRWRGERVRPFAPRLRQAVAYAGHLPALKDELTTEENLASLVRLAGADSSADEMRTALDEVALGRQRTLPARVLSAGQRRRIGLARLRLVKRPLWVLDEPVTALDAAGTALLAGMVRGHLRQGGIAVAATHQRLDLGDAPNAEVTLGG